LYVGAVLRFVAPPVPVSLSRLAIVSSRACRWSSTRGIQLCDISAVTLALLLSGIYLLINASWSLVPAFAYRAIAMFFIAVGAHYLIQNCPPKLDAAVLRAMSFGLILGFGVASVLLCVEVCSGVSMGCQLTSIFPELQ